jgi:O-antigen ligase
VHVPHQPSRHAKAARIGRFALPGALTVYLGFSGGGFFAGEPAKVAVLLAVLLVLRTTLAERPSEGFGRLLLVAGAALGLFAVWCLLSALWSDAPARAMIEFDRALMYWLALVLFASVASRADDVDWTVRGVAVGMWVVCGAGLISRTLPEVWPIEPNIVNERLSYPLTYWNAMGVIAALSIIFAVHLTCSEREPAPVRVIAAGVLPALLATLMFTFSRGGIAVGVIGVVAYLILARPRGAVGGLLAVVPTSVIAAIVALDADLLAMDDPTTRAAVDQGETVALTVGACMLVAVLVRAAALLVDRRLSRLSIGPAARRMGGGLAVTVAVGAVLVALVGFDGAGYLDRQLERFTEGTTSTETGAQRGRLTDPSNNGRLDHWEVALSAFEAEPVLGTGAGTYANEWLRQREIPMDVEDAHSLYLETLGELGLPGLLLLAAAILAILAAFASGLRSERRHVHAALLAAGLAWAAHAGIDWDWEMAAVTLWFFALGGACLARSPVREPQSPPRRIVRVAVSVALLALAVTPALIAASQSALNNSVAGLKAGDCDRAIDSALQSVSASSVRAEPYLVLSLCDSRLDAQELAVRTARRAIRLDPDNWRTHYTLALAQANAGTDPRPAMRTALALNPLGSIPREAGRRLLTTKDPQKWRRRARMTRLPIE